MARRVLRCDQKTLEKDVSGKVYIVTGANSGVGLETTRQLVRQGGHVVMACRRVEAGEEEAKTFGGLKGGWEVMGLDLADLQSVRDFVTSFCDSYERLDGLVCNAGAVFMGSEAAYTVDGFEKTIGVNYLGHFLLTELLLDVLKKSSPSRMVIVSSVVHAGRPTNRPQIHFDDLHYRERRYRAFDAYAEAKVADVLYAKELAERLRDAGVSAFSVHPGWARSNFGSGGNLLMRTLLTIMRPLTRGLSDSNEDSAQTSLHCLLSDSASDHSGAYFSQSSVLYRDKEYKKGGWPMDSPNPNATDMETAVELVQVSRQLVGLDR
ncbi:MAG: SDR family NAD(P)-dependent oxidoreductase [Acidimicrobiia bacterium]|nr:SDR family NAD(P)-dependent oxidoreductase [Acidimicrobiia bacterium]MYF83014.1 SDR family NAD(P)-dependent oxidoreductase [Acidimicrobiia bacterium]